VVVNHVEVTVVFAVAAPTVVEQEFPGPRPLAACVCEALGLEGETVMVVEALALQAHSKPEAWIGGTVTVMAS